MGTLKRILLVLSMVVVVAPLSGCQQLIGKAAEFAAEVLPLIAEAGAVLDAVDAQAANHFKATPNRELEAKYAQAMARARLSLSSASRLGEGTKHLDRAEVGKAFDEYEKAFSEVMAIIGPLGIVRPGAADTLMAGDGDGALTIPLPRALTYSAGGE